MPTVYALTDPRTREIRYVGVSDDPLRRWREHVFAPSPTLAGWVAEVVWPELRLLEVVTLGYKSPAEKHWIAEVTARGHRLLNRTRGG